MLAKAASGIHIANRFAQTVAIVAVPSDRLSFGRIGFAQFICHLQQIGSTNLQCVGHPFIFSACKRVR